MNSGSKSVNCGSDCQPRSPARACAGPMCSIDHLWNASCDSQTVKMVQPPSAGPVAMASLRTDRTSFVIAHRLSTIRDADVILMMENGQIVETGTHDSLLASGGAYAHLYAAQFNASVDEVAAASTLAHAQATIG